MKKQFLLAVALLAFTANAPFFSAAAADHYTLDPLHTNITWHANHFGFSNPSGKFSEVSGDVFLDEKNPVDSKVTVKIKTGSVASGFSLFDEHLRGKIFEAEKFPEADFASTKVEPIGKDKAKVTGNLTLHGVTKPVVLDVTLNKLGENMMHKKTAGFSAHTVLKRSDFGMTYGIPSVSDEVPLDIEAEANLAEAP